MWLQLCCGTAVVFGHVWPIYHRFRGGKGGATLVGTLIVLGPALIGPLLLVWALTFVLSGYVGLATMSAAVSVPVWIAITRLPAEQPLFIYAAVMAGYIVRWHRTNIAGMKDGTEHRNLKFMIFSGKHKTVDDEQA
jgi:glycerol-3-phosphate acyltransferase PlsY